MRQPVISLSLATCLALSLAACGTDAGSPTRPMVASEGECRASSPAYRCKFEHDLGGGYPFTLDYSNDPG